MNKWHGVDLDGTLAEHYWPEKGPYDPLRIGDPVPAMVARVRAWVAAGEAVKIFTARVDGGQYAKAMALADGIPEAVVSVHVNETHRIVSAIEQWCLEVFGYTLPVTCTKDYGMIDLWDDRAVRVILNTGEPCCLQHTA